MRLLSLLVYTFFTIVLFVFVLFKIAGVGLLTGLWFTTYVACLLVCSRYGSEESDGRAGSSG